jgi:hypothetical protein
VARVKLLPTPLQAAALEATLHACNEAATPVAAGQITTPDRDENTPYNVVSVPLV